MKKLLKLFIVLMTALGFVSCQNPSNSSNQGTSSNSPSPMTKLFDDELIISYGVGKSGVADLKKETVPFSEILSESPVLEKRCYRGLFEVRTNETIYISQISFKIESEWEFYMNSSLCDSEANWSYDETLQHIVPGVETTLTFSFDNFKVKRMKNLMIQFMPLDVNGNVNKITDESQLNDWIYTIYDLKIVATTNK